MKHVNLGKIFLIGGITFLVGVQTANAQFFKKLGNGIKNAAENGVENTTTSHAENDASTVTDKGLDKVEHPFKKHHKKDKEETQNTTNNSNSGNENTTGNNNAAASNTVDNNNTPTIKSYQNYDFVPGDTIIFEDDFTEDMDGEFPAHWTLDKGQAVVNKITGKTAFLITEGNYAHVYPRMKTKSYLSKSFTIEFDYYAAKSDWPLISLKYKNNDGNEEEGYVSFSSHGGVSTSYFPGNSFDAPYPNEDDATFKNKWHHAALIYKNGQLKCYIDQYRILVVPDIKVVPYSFGFAGVGTLDDPIIFTNIRVAKGGNMNMISKKFTKSKLVTHGITFDVNKADIKPQSMGTLNMIVSIMKNNPDLKFEIDGHTDNTGDAASNMKLSEDRAQAVREQLIKMGISATRLTTKGYGETKPISGNDTQEGKANNRRVEFVKI